MSKKNKIIKLNAVQKREHAYQNGEFSRLPKGIQREEVVRFWNNGHGIPWIAQHLNCSEQNAWYHINTAEKEGVALRKTPFAINKMLTKLARGEPTRFEFGEEVESADNVRITPLQRVFLGLALRQPKKRFSLMECAAFYWQTVCSVVERGLAKLVTDEKDQAVYCTPTDIGMIVSHQNPPVEIVLKELKEGAA